MPSHNKNSTPLFLRIFKTYLKNYEGFSIQCWRHIMASFLEAIVGGICFFLSIYFVEKLHLDMATAGLILSVYGIGKAVGGLLGGRLSDKFSPIWILSVSLTIEALAFLLLALVHAPILLMISLFVLGFGSYGFITANNIIVLNLNSQEQVKLKALGMLHVASNLGIGFSAIIISLLFKLGFQLLFFSASGILLVIAIYFSMQSEQIEVLSSSELTKKNSIEINNNNLNKTIVRLTLFCLFLVGLTIAQLGSTYSLYINQRFSYLGIDAVGYLFALNSFLIVFFQTPLVNYFSNANKIYLTGIGGFLMGLGMFALSFSIIYFIAILACILYTIGEMLFFSTAQLVIYKNSESKNKGQMLGLFRMTFAISIAVGPAMGGYLYQHVGAEFVWYVSGLIGLVCLIYGSWFGRVESNINSLARHMD